MFDLIITGGTVIDEMGSPSSPDDIGTTGERIADVGDLRSSEGRNVIDAPGLVVSPGFIDTHAYSDASLIVDPQHPVGLRQSITAEILSQDSLS